jgi:hypothetical protein
MGLKNLPLASGHAHAAAFVRCGWTIARRGKNHIILTREGFEATLSIPDHGEVKRALIQAQIRRAKLTEEEYLKCFNAKR